MAERESLEPPRIQVIRLCRSIRESAELSQAVFAEHYLPGKGKSQVSYFEGGTWPRDVEVFIEAYAILAGSTAIDLWSRALDVWRSEEYDGSAPAVNLDRVARRLIDG